MIITIEFKGRFASFKPVQTLDFLSFRRERSHLQKQLWSTEAQLFSATICTDYSFSHLLFVLIYLWFPPEYFWNNFSHFFFYLDRMKKDKSGNCSTLLASQKIPNINMRAVIQIPREKNKTVFNFGPDVGWNVLETGHCLTERCLIVVMRRIWVQICPPSLNLSKLKVFFLKMCRFFSWS